MSGTKGDAQLFRILDEKVDLLMQARQAGEALRVAEKAAEIAARAFSPEDLRRARVLRKMGILLRAENRPQEALAAFEQALDACEAGADHRLRARLHAHAGFLADELSEESAARRHYEQAVALEGDADYLEPATAAVIHNNLAVIRKSEGRTAAAAEHYHAALAACEAAHGPDHLEVAVLLVNLANFHLNENQLEDAIALHRRALGIRERHLPAGHADLAWSQAHLALAHQLRGEAAVAEPIYLEAFGIWEKAGVPAGSGAFTVACENFAQLLRNDGREKEARQFENRAKKLAG